MKFLRGTALDIFSYTEERQHERQWIADYLALTEEFCASLSKERLASAIALAEIPQKIRGFGHVKERNMLEARKHWASLMQSYGEQRPLS